MSRFHYAAVIPSGERIRGVIRSSNGQEAARKLLEMGYHPLAIDEAQESGWLRPRVSGGFFRKVSAVDLAVFTRQLASLLKAGLPIVQALRAVEKQSGNLLMSRSIGAIEEMLSQDAGALSDALDEHAHIFDPVYRGLVRSGEAGGNLAEVLQNLAKYLAQSAKLRGQVLNAFIYPVFLVVCGTAAIFVLMSFVIPRFEELFRSFGQSLPGPTRLLIAVSGFMATWWWGVLLAGGAIASLMYAIVRRPYVRKVVDRQLIRIPVLGPMLMKIEIARIAHTFAALLNSGIRILETLQITSETAKNMAVRQSFRAIISGVSAGEPLAATIEKTGLYPPMMVSLIATGEETGELPEMLRELAAIYNDEAERAVTGAIKLLEPILIIVLGGLIAGIVAAVILPIFRANAMVAN